MLVLHRLVPPRASLADGPSGAADALAKLVREPRKQTHDGLDVTYVPYCIAPPLRLLRDMGSVGRTDARAGAAPAAPLVRVRPDPRPQRRAGRRRRAPRTRGRAVGGLGARRRRALHGSRSADRQRRGRRGGGARAGRGAPGARQQPRNRRALARTWRPRDACGASRRRSTQPPAFVTAHGIARTGGDDEDGRPTRPVARDGRAPGRTQAPRRRPARAGSAFQRHPTLRYEIIGEGPERVALEGLAARLGIAERVEFHGQLPPDAGDRTGAELHAVRDALDRGGVRRGLYRGDGRRRARNRLPRRARARGDRRSRRRLHARAPRRHRAAHAAHRRAPV